MATTGTLFSPLLAATTFTLVLRLLGTDKLIEGWIAAMPGGQIAVCAAILGAIFVAAFVLDAFEIIFVAVPILIPPLLIRVPDAVWVSTLVLLTLQASFLLPPVGYALMMTRGILGSEVPPHDLRPGAGAVPGHAGAGRGAHARLPEASCICWSRRTPSRAPARPDSHEGRGGEEAAGDAARSPSRSGSPK